MSQPALSSPTIENFTRIAQARRDALVISDLTIECITTLSEQARLAGNDHVYSDPYFLVQLADGTRGCCFGFPADSQLDVRPFIGCSALAALNGAPDFLAVCLLDAIFQTLNHLDGIGPARSVPYAGTAAQNGRLQARVIADLANVHAGATVALVGVVEDIVTELLDCDAIPLLADLYLARDEVCGLLVGDNATAAIAQADAVIMTGNTLKTRTLDALLHQATTRGARTVVFAMSGASLAPRYLAFGASAVTVERFPYFWYPGLSATIDVYA